MHSGAQRWLQAGESRAPAAVAFAPFQPGGMLWDVMGWEEMPCCQALLQNTKVVPHPY